MTIKVSLWLLIHYACHYDYPSNQVCAPLVTLDIKACNSNQARFGKNIDGNDWTNWSLNNMAHILASSSLKMSLFQTKVNRNLFLCSASGIAGRRRSTNSLAKTITTEFIDACTYLRHQNAQYIWGKNGCYTLTCWYFIRFLLLLVVQWSTDQYFSVSSPTTANYQFENFVHRFNFI